MSVESDAIAAGPATAAPASLEANYKRTIVSIAVSVTTASLAFNFWMPFLPLFMLELGATSEANAVFWVATATIAQGVTRLLSGPIWGVLSDRLGRKMMFLRALYFGTLTTLIAAFVTDPWQIAIAFGCQGFFSGFIPAAVALTSVTVPESRLNSSLSYVTGAQQLGNMVGPAIGGVLAILVGYRGAIFFAALLPALAATMVLFFVPADEVGGHRRMDGKVDEKPELEPFMSQVTLQFVLAIFLFFSLIMLMQLLRIVTPIALRQLTDGDVTNVNALTFSLGGLASTVSVLFLAQHFFRRGRIRTALVVSAALTGAGHILLAMTGTVPLFVIGFAVISLLQAAMIPATNTIIAANVSRARRGTAFGVASSAMAIAFMVGPAIAAVFAAVSLDLGFVVIGALFFGLGLLLLACLREPSLEGERVSQKS